MSAKLVPCILALPVREVSREVTVGATKVTRETRRGTFYVNVSKSLLIPRTGLPEVLKRVRG